MLFLAVTLGFLVENEREHFIEHKREKQFIRSFIVDVELDTAVLNQILIKRMRREGMLDSLTMLLNSAEKDRYMPRIYYLGRHLQRLFDVSFTYNDRTIQQLKNSGNMRLIRRRNASDAIIIYDGKVRDMKVTEERENQYMYLTLPYAYRIFDGLVFDKMIDSINNISEPSAGIILLSTANASIPEFNAALNTVKSANIANLERAKMLVQEGEKLLNTLKKEYHLE